MIRENISGMKSLEKLPDGREFALCRHFAPTFEQACNLWAKRKGVANSIQCQSAAKLSLFHAWPVVKITANGKDYEYIYDLLNDPFTPDLVPLNSNAEQAARLPCE